MKRFLFFSLCILHFALCTSFAQNMVGMTAQEMYDQAYQAWSQDEYETALSYLNQLCNNPDDCTTSVLYMAADCLYELDEFETSAQIALKLLQGNALPGKNNAIRRAWCYIYIGAYAYDLNEFNYAISFFNMAIKEKKDIARAYYERGYAYYMLDKNKQAEKDFKQALKIAPEYTAPLVGLAHVYVESNDFVKADECFRQVFARRGYNDYDLQNYAGSLVVRGDSLEGFRMLMTSMAKEHNRTNARRFTRYAQHNPVLMRQVIEEQLEREPYNPFWWNMMGHFMADYLDRKDSAFAYYYKAFEMEPLYADAFSGPKQMVVALTAMGAYGDAEAIANMAINHNNSREAMYRLIPYIYNSAGERERAYEELKKLYDVNPEENKSMLSELGSLAMAAHRYEDARNYFGLRVQDNANDDRAFSCLGEIHAVLGDTIQSRWCYEKVLELNEEHLLKSDSITVNLGNPIPYELARAYVGLGEYSKAYHAAQSRLVSILLGSAMNHTTDNQSPTDFYNVACIFSRVDSLSEAYEALEMAMEKGFINTDIVRNDEDLVNLHNLPATDSIALKYDSLIAHYDSIRSEAVRVMRASMSPLPESELNGSAHFMGGVGELERYLRLMMVYPAQAKKKKIQGTTRIQATVSFGGELENVRVMEPSGNELLDEEALRLVNNMPLWQPARVAGRAIVEDVTIDVPFVL